MPPPSSGGPAAAEARVRRRSLAAGAALAGLGVVLGAFGAHGLKAMLDAERLGWWQTGVQYQVWHGLALVALSAAPIERPKLPAWLLGAGACVFSVSLYAMAMILGWPVLVRRALRN